METVTVGEFDYQIGKLNPFQQFHVARRLAPIVLSMQSAANAPEADQNALLNEAVVKGMASLKEEDADYILHTCLAVCYREQKLGNNVSRVPIQAKNSDSLMFEDIDASIMMQLALEVIVKNLSGFFTSALLK